MITYLCLITVPGVLLNEQYNDLPVFFPYFAIVSVTGIAIWVV